MTGYKIPIFQRGSLLTQEMLQAMKEYMVEITTIQYAEYSDGILSGMQIQVSDGVITIGKGLLKYKDTLLVMPENVTVLIPNNNQLQLVKCCIRDKEMSAEFETMEMDIVVDTSTEKRQNEIEICRMHMQNGAKLRSQYKSLEDMSTNYDTIQVIEADWAACKSKGISPQILQQFAREVRESQGKELIDICFLQQILAMEGRACSRELIEFYVSEKLNITQKEYTNQELYQGLCKVLQQLKGKTFIKQRAQENRRMIVD